MKRVALLTILMVLMISGFSQIQVNYLNHVPIIDGKFDESFNKQELKLISVSTVYKSNDKLESIDVNYAIAYNASYLYLYIQADADSLITRDRGYQNGDGLHLVIGKQKPDNQPTDEFYVLGFSAKKDWSHKINWYYNINLHFRKLGNDVKCETFSGKDQLSFEIMIPWKVVKPYHPWLMDEIGLNMCFVKAVGKKDKINHFLEFDKRMQSEGSLRKYVPAQFEKPDNYSGVYCLPSSRNLKINRQLPIRFAGYHEHSQTNNYHFKIVDESGKVVRQYNKPIIWEKGLSVKSIELPSIKKAGNYSVEINGSGIQEITHKITLLSNFDVEETKKKLEIHKADINPSTYHTLAFKIQTIEQKTKRLKSYELATELLVQMNELDTLFMEISRGKDPVQEQRGVFRRAFLSELDTTLRPYSIYVPENYNPNKIYPLLVYLHGSGDDDCVLKRTNIIKNDFIVVAPNGRGTSNCYATPEAQADIAEAINDVVRNYGVDEHQIILSGFSMGGYGVLRTYYENPERYSKIAIISGHPSLAEKWGKGDKISFLDKDLIAVFDDVPVFIFHSRNDMNCPYTLMETFVKDLKKYNTDVQLHVGESGHGGLNKEAWAKYEQWLLSE